MTKPYYIHGIYQKRVHHAGERRFQSHSFTSAERFETSREALTRLSELSREYDFVTSGITNENTKMTEYV